MDNQRLGTLSALATLIADVSPYRASPITAHCGNWFSSCRPDTRRWFSVLGNQQPSFWSLVTLLYMKWRATCVPQHPNQCGVIRRHGGLKRRYGFLCDLLSGLDLLSSPRLCFHGKVN